MAAARKSDLYINLITSGIPADPERLARLVAAGLDSLQLSVQDSDPHGAAWIAGRDDLEAKMKTAAATQALGLPLTLNVVLHRGNIARVPEFVALAETDRRRPPRAGQHAVPRLGARQPGGAASVAGRRRRSARRRARRTRSVAWQDGDPLRAPRLLRRSPARLHGRLGAPLRRRHARRDRAPLPPGAGDRRAVLVLAERPRAFARRRSGPKVLASAPFAARPGCPQPCRTCDERTVDFGGCRCQAFALLGDAAATDPACALAPRHDLVVAARAQAAEAPTESPLRLRRLRQVQ